MSVWRSLERVNTGLTTGAIGVLAVAPFMGHGAAVFYRGSTSDSSTLVHNIPR
jgi:hypothetical protein